MRGVAALGLALAGILAGAGCTTTRPYQREKLAKPAMAVDRDRDRVALEAHVIAIQEGAIGGAGGGGGGCGCN